ncbi:MAG TPA: hypothetical protein DCS93_23465 [Microscillaceae bacterium]|nr:hypothetical protein [Microscillaceae bacterium]
MKNQEEKPGTLLKALREKLGYTSEDWANIFETTPTLIASIELGYELPQEFLIKLIKWIISGLEHPHNTTQIWKQEAPKTINTILGEIGLEASQLEHLRDAHDLQARLIKKARNDLKAHAEQVEAYEQIIEGYRANIADLEKKQGLEQKISRWKYVNYAVWILASFALGGMLIHFSDQWQPKSPQVAQIHPKPPNDALAHRVKVAAPEEKKEEVIKPILKTVNPLAQRRVRTQNSGVAKIINTPPKTVLGANEELSVLLALNEERKEKLHEQYISNQGKTILKFNNLANKKVVLVVNNSEQREIHRDTLQSREYLLDVGNYLPGKYYYWMYHLSNTSNGQNGVFVIKERK